MENKNENQSDNDSSDSGDETTVKDNDKKKPDKAKWTEAEVLLVIYSNEMHH